MIHSADKTWRREEEKKLEKMKKKWGRQTQAGVCGIH